jgi:hypothetical protein
LLFCIKNNWSEAAALMKTRPRNISLKSSISGEYVSYETDEGLIPVT